MINNQILEVQMVKFQDLMKVKVKDNKEYFVPIEIDKIPFGYATIFSEMEETLGKTMSVRKGTWERLLLAQKILQDKNSGLSLFITFGYRSLEIQTNRFLQRLKAYSSIFFPNPYDLYEEVHRSIAVPTVAGHPTGGAIDVIIVRNKNMQTINFGSKQYDYSTKKCYFFAQNILLTKLLLCLSLDLLLYPFQSLILHLP